VTTDQRSSLSFSMNSSVGVCSAFRRAKIFVRARARVAADGAEKMENSAKLCSASLAASFNSESHHNFGSSSS